MPYRRILFEIIISISILLITIHHGSGEIEKAANGGPVTNMANYSFQAVILIVTKNEVTKVCGGTIVTEFHVLTTSTCFSKMQNSYYDIQVRVGSVNVLEGGDVYNASKVERHPEFDAYVSQHNLAIVFIKKGITFVDSKSDVLESGGTYVKSVGPVPMAYQFIIGGEKVTISGYSKKAMHTPQANLQDIRTFSMSIFPCIDYYRETDTTVNLIQDELLCARNLPTNGFCDILEGSPIIREERLIGLLTGDTCNNEKNPLIFTRIANYLLWLQLNVHSDRFKGTNNTCAGA